MKRIFFAAVCLFSLAIKMDLRAQNQPLPQKSDMSNSHLGALVQLSKKPAEDFTLGLALFIDQLSVPEQKALRFLCQGLSEKKQCPQRLSAVANYCLAMFEVKEEQWQSVVRRLSRMKSYAPEQLQSVSDLMREQVLYRAQRWGILAESLALDKGAAYAEQLRYFCALYEDGNSMLDYRSETWQKVSQKTNLPLQALRMGGLARAEWHRNNLAENESSLMHWQRLRFSQSALSEVLQLPESIHPQLHLLYMEWYYRLQDGDGLVYFSRDFLNAAPEKYIQEHLRLCLMHGVLPEFMDIKDEKRRRQAYYFYLKMTQGEAAANLFDKLVDLGEPMLQSWQFFTLLKLTQSKQFFKIYCQKRLKKYLESPSTPSEDKQDLLRYVVGHCLQREQFSAAMSFFDKATETTGLWPLSAATHAKGGLPEESVRICLHAAVHEKSAVAQLMATYYAQQCRRPIDLSFKYRSRLLQQNLAGDIVKLMNLYRNNKALQKEYLWLAKKLLQSPLLDLSLRQQALKPLLMATTETCDRGAYAQEYSRLLSLNANWLQRPDLAWEAGYWNHLSQLFLQDEVKNGLVREFFNAYSRDPFALETLWALLSPEQKATLTPLLRSQLRATQQRVSKGVVHGQDGIIARASVLSHISGIDCQRWQTILSRYLRSNEQAQSRFILSKLPGLSDIQQSQGASDKSNSLLKK